MPFCLSKLKSQNCKQVHSQKDIALRPFTQGKCFLLFLPDSHSAYYDSFVSALGRSLPPSLGLSRICCTWSGFWWKRRVGRGGVGGGLAQPPPHTAISAGSWLCGSITLLVSLPVTTCQHSYIQLVSEPLSCIATCNTVHVSLLCMQSLHTKQRKKLHPYITLFF